MVTLVLSSTFVLLNFAEQPRLHLPLLMHSFFKQFRTFTRFPNQGMGSSALIEEVSQFSLVQSLSRVQLFVTPWTAACHMSLSITNSWSLLKLMPIGSVMPSNHLILCHPLLLQPSIFPCIRVFSNESALHIRWPEYWSFTFSISPSKLHPSLVVSILMH